jgi:hypothetical protein
MATYRSFCITTNQETAKALENTKDNPVFTPAPDPTRRFWQSADGYGTSIFPKPEFADHKKPEDIPQNEILINAPSADEAQNILSTIYAGMLLINPDLELTGQLQESHELNSEFNPALYSESWYYRRFTSFPEFSFGTLVWAKARSDRSLLYALEKYRLSLSLDSFTLNSVDPRNGQVFANYDAQFSYHTTAAFATIAAFSAVEEVGLEIRASKENPRFTDNKNGTWNPIVLGDIEGRLSQIGINPTDTTIWVYRGQPTKIENDIKPKFGHPSPHHDGAVVRDIVLTFPEAIQYAAYLRNFISAHKFQKLTEYVSPYEVFNVQDLVRKLLMSKLGL